MNTIKKVFLLLAAFVAISSKAQGPCNASNSPTFQVTISQATLATNGACGMEIIIMNAVTNPMPGGPVSYSLFAPGQSSPVIPTPTIATIAGVWTVTVMDNTNYCMTSQTVQVNILAAPTLSVVASNTLFCSGHMVTLTASGANSYIWNTGPTTASISVIPAATFTYSVKGTGSNGCANITSGIINVNPSPNVAATANQNSVCVNQSIQLTAQGANTYTWNNSATGSQYTTSAFTATGSLTYTVQLQGTDNTGCVGTNFVSVTVLVQACETVGVTEYSNSNQIKIYPNPANEILNVEFENMTTEIKMVDFSGKEVLSVKNTKQINVSELPEGVYFIFISNDKNEKVTGKLLIAR